MNLLEHSKDCVPLVPCKACELVAWLRSKLTDEDNQELVKRAQALIPPKRIRKVRSRDGHSLGTEPSTPRLVP